MLFVAHLFCIYCANISFVYKVIFYNFSIQNLFFFLSFLVCIYNFNFFRFRVVYFKKIFLLFTYKFIYFLLYCYFFIIPLAYIFFFFNFLYFKFINLKVSMYIEINSNWNFTFSV